MDRRSSKLRPRVILDVVKHFGPGWVLARGKYQLRLRMGHVRRSCPLTSWDELSDDNIFRSDSDATAKDLKEYRQDRGPRFFFAPSRIKEMGNITLTWDKDGAGPTKGAERLIDGRFLLFGSLELDTGFPPDWHRNYLLNLNAPCQAHWSTLSDFAYGDIKLIWELSRFSFAFTLARAYARTGREEFAETFWLAVEDWLEANPPQAGVNWKCGQEISLRLMAWCFALQAFLNAEASTEQRTFNLVRALHHFGQRIEANLDYALSQNNNHGISEVAGLWTLGVLFPEFKDAEHWREIGELQLEKQADKLIYSDGGFSQQSPNYHRLVLQLYTWVLGLGCLNGREFSQELKDRLRAALNWSYQMMEPLNGQMPSSGGQDGAHFLPLSNCPYGDHRPTLQALAYLLDGESPFAAGPWDEQVLWLFGPAALEAPRRSRPQTDFWQREGGFHTLRDPSSWAVLRCGPYQHRPVHADLLHLDLWWRGVNVALDPGSYSYNPQEPMQKGLGGTEFHNTVSVAGQDQMNRVGRFMWLPWSKSSLLGAKRSERGTLAWMEGVHLGYQRLSGGPIHRRSVISINGQWWLVLDFLQGSEQHSRLHWLFADAPYTWNPELVRLSLGYSVGGFQIEVGAATIEAAAAVVRADPASPRGWCSPYYQICQKAISLSLSTHPGNELYFSGLGPEGFRLEHQGQDFFFSAKDFRAHVHLEPGAESVTPSSGFVTLEGETDDRLILP